MTGKALTLTIVLGAVLILATFNGCQRSASAHPFGGDGFWDTDRKVGLIKFVMAKELDLTEAQQAELDRIVADLKSYHELHKADGDTLKSELMSELSKDRVTSLELLQIFDKYRPVMESKVDIISRKAAEFHALLTPEQRIAVAERIESHAGGRCGFGRRFSNSHDPDEIEKRVDILKYVISSELNLSDDQQVQLEGIIGNLQLQHDVLREEMRSFKTTLTALWGQERLDADELKQAIDAYRPAFEKMAGVAAETMETVHTMLTPVQRTVLLNRMETMKHGTRWGHPW